VTRLNVNIDCAKARIAPTPQMRARGHGAIVNVSSLAAIVTLRFHGLYGASKHAVVAISEALYLELRGFAVRVAVIEPGIFPTGFRDAAVTDPARPFRQLVGPDALRMVPAYRDAPDFEIFARGVLRPLGV
jgi:short-subunit dehydrogenase